MSMKRQVGLWIDPRETFVVSLSDQGEETTRIESGMESMSGTVAGTDQKGARQTTSETDNSRRTSTDTMTR
jgi:hypothetical protein